VPDIIVMDGIEADGTIEGTDGIRGVWVVDVSTQGLPNMGRHAAGAAHA